MAGSALAFLALPIPSRAQEPGLTAEEALANARRVWSLSPQLEQADLPPPCPEEADPDVIVVCSERAAPGDVMSVIKPPVKADGGAPRAPELSGSCLRTRGRQNCIMMGNVPDYPPLIDMTAFPEELSEEDAAAVIRAD